MAKKLRLKTGKKSNLADLEIEKEVYNNLAENLNPAQVNEDIVDVHAINPSLVGSKEFAQMLNAARGSLKKGASSMEVAAAYSTIYTQVSSGRAQLIREVDRVRDFYLADTLLDQMTEDALTPEIATGKILEVSYKGDAKIKKELEELSDRLCFDQMAQNITPDMLAYGEYTLKPEINPVLEGKQNGDELMGLVDVHDNVDQAAIVALTKHGKTDGYLEIGPRGSVITRSPSQFIKFTLGGQRIRVDLTKDILNQANTYNTNKKKEELFRKIPRYLRVGKSVLFKIIPKIKELELLEKLVPATKISKLSSGTLVGIQVPPNYSVDNAIQATERIEGLINKKVNLDPETGELSVDNIMATAGQFKAIPVFGDKGQLEKIDFKSDEPDDLLASITDLRQVISESIGVPYEFLFKSDGENKSETLKRYARYLRRLKKIQKAITDGVRQMVEIHLVNINVEFDPKKIQIEFRNKLVEIDNLDKLEHMDATVSLLGNLMEFIGNLSAEESPFAEVVDLDVAKDYIEDNLKTIGLQGLLSKKGGKIIEPEDLPPAEDDEEPEDDEPEEEPEDDEEEPEEEPEDDEEEPEDDEE